MSAEAAERMRETIEAVAHTRAQLAEWGVPWPPPRGWKRRLIEEAARGEGALTEVDRLRAALEHARRERDEARQEADRLRGWINEVWFDSECHHEDQKSHELAHALLVEIPHLCEQALDGEPLPPLTHDRAPVCSSTGAVGCLDCAEGICDGLTTYEWRTFCACGGDDVYGEMYHFELCPLHDPDDR